MPRKPKCKHCKTEFQKFLPLQVVCSPACALKLVETKRSKKDRAETREMRQKLKTKSDHLKDAQAEFNKYIRARDKGNSCISCGGNTGAKMNAGHYKSVGAYPELRFTEINCHLQCEHCNSYLSGNVIEYRKNLLLKIGDRKVNWIEGPHEPLNLTIDEIKEIKTKYRAKTKELGNER